MASITREKNGRKTVQFVGTDRKRRSIRLGKVTDRRAENHRHHIEQLIATSAVGRHPEPETASWLDGLNDDLRDRLARAGLIAERSSVELGAYCEAYIAGRTDVKDRTHQKYRTTQSFLISFFGADRKLPTVSSGDADDFERWLRRPPKNKSGTACDLRAENTVRKHIAVCKLFFGAAVRKRLIPSSPFEDLNATIQENRERMYFVSTAEIETVLAACPDTQWELIVALSRYGGLRCPSEHLALTWADVDWERDRITVSSPKTEHHHGKAYRTIPLFAELKPILETAFEQAAPGTKHIITRYRDTNSNLRTQFLRIIRRAGLQPWPKLFQNLRSSRQTELAESFPSHVVCEWIGNSEEVARKHYLQVTDDHFARAIINPVHNPVQSGHALSRTTESANPQTPRKQEYSTPRETVRNEKIAEAGLEPARSFRNFGF